MRLSVSSLLSVLIAVAFLAAFVVAVVQSGGAETKRGTEVLLNEVATVEAALAQAKTEGKTVMIDFYADWCPPCKKMQEEAFTDKGVADLLKDTLFVSVDVDHPGANQAAVDRFKPSALPTVVFLSADGKAIGRTLGFGGVASFKAEIRRILDKV